MSFVNGYRQQHSNPGGMNSLPPSGMPPVHYVPTYLPSSAEAHAQASSTSRPTVATASQLNFGTSAAPGNAAYHPPAVHHHVGWPYYAPVHPIYQGPPVYGTLPDFNKPPYTTANMGQPRVPPAPYPGTVNGAPAPVSSNANAPGLGANSFRPSREAGQSIPSDAQVLREMSNGGLEPARMQAAFRPLPAPGFLPVSWYQPFYDPRVAIQEKLANQQQHLARLAATTRMEQQQQQRLAERVRQDELRDLLDADRVKDQDINEDKTPKPHGGQTQTTASSGGHPWQSRFFPLPPTSVIVPAPSTYASDSSASKDRWELISSSSSATTPVEMISATATGDSTDGRVTGMTPTQVEYLRYGDPRFANDPTPAPVAPAATQAKSNLEPAPGPEPTRDSSAYGLKAEDIFGADDFTASTPTDTGLLDPATAHAGLPGWAAWGIQPQISVPVAAAVPPPSSPVIAQRYLENLIKNPLNTPASVALLRILKDEDVALDSSLGLKLLDLAQDLQTSGPHFRNNRAPVVPDATAKKSRPLPALKKKITTDQIMDKLNEFVPVLNTIAGAVGISLLEDPSEPTAHNDSSLPEMAPAACAPAPHTSTIDRGSAAAPPFRPLFGPKPRVNALELQELHGSGISSSESSSQVQGAVRPPMGDADVPLVSDNGTRPPREEPIMLSFYNKVMEPAVHKMSDERLPTVADVGPLFGGLSINDTREDKNVAGEDKDKPTKHVGVEEVKKKDDHVPLTGSGAQNDPSYPDHLSTVAVMGDDFEEAVGQYTPFRPSRSTFHVSPNTPDIASIPLRPRSENHSIYGPHYDRHGIQVPPVSISEHPRWWSHHPYYHPEHRAARMSGFDTGTYYGPPRQNPMWPSPTWGPELWGQANPSMYGYYNYGEPGRSFAFGQ